MIRTLSARARTAAVAAWLVVVAGGCDMTIEFFVFDQPVDIVIPDPSEVGTLDPSVLVGN